MRPDLQDRLLKASQQIEKLDQVRSTVETAYDESPRSLVAHAAILAAEAAAALTGHEDDVGVVHRAYEEVFAALENSPAFHEMIQWRTKTAATKSTDLEATRKVIAEFRARMRGLKVAYPQTGGGEELVYRDLVPLIHKDQGLVKDPGVQKLLEWLEKEKSIPEYMVPRFVHSRPALNKMKEIVQEAKRLKSDRVRNPQKEQGGTWEETDTKIPEPQKTPVVPRKYWKSPLFINNFDGKNAPPEVQVGMARLFEGLGKRGRQSITYGELVRLLAEQRKAGSRRSPLYKALVYMKKKATESIMASDPSKD